MATQVPPPKEFDAPPAVVQGTGPKAPNGKRKLVRRTDIDRSQWYRRSFQDTFLLLNLWLGMRFYFWVRQFETGALSSSVHKTNGRSEGIGEVRNPAFSNANKAEKAVLLG